eukprot:TRINITY_DN1618_c0_g1_i1.p1 TRINITY_DN1618_c0_g1~~TRINITY_DN1618_c0_g1_i1.p1  ORF type:complete len:390 (+),score=104.74 TRINITY_DN1618_c0_g1_i1:35-1204(+)
MNKNFDEFNDLKFLDNGKDELILCATSNYGCKIFRIEKLEPNNNEGEINHEKNFAENSKNKELYNSNIGPTAYMDIRCDKNVIAMIGVVDHQILNPRMLYLHKMESDSEERVVEGGFRGTDSFNEITFREEKLIKKEEKYLKDERYMFPTPIFQVHMAQISKYVMVVLQNKIIALDYLSLVFKEQFDVFVYEGKPIYCFADTKNRLLVSYIEKSEVKEDTVKIASVGEFSMEFSFSLPKCSCLVFSKDGDLLATAQEDGKKIVIYSIDINNKSAKIIYKFTKSTSSSVITSIVFSNDKSLVSVCSDSKTTHVFKLGKENLYEKYNTYLALSYPYSFLRINFGTVPATQCFSLDSKRLYVITRENVLYLVSIPIDRDRVTRVEPKNYRIL